MSCATLTGRSPIFLPTNQSKETWHLAQTTVSYLVHSHIMSSFSEGEFGKRHRFYDQCPLYYVPLWKCTLHRSDICMYSFHLNGSRRPTIGEKTIVALTFSLLEFEFILTVVTVPPAPQHLERSARPQSVGQAPVPGEPLLSELQTQGCLRRWAQWLGSCSEEGQVGAFHLQGKNPWILWMNIPRYPPGCIVGKVWSLLDAQNWGDTSIRAIKHLDRFPKGIILQPHTSHHSFRVFFWKISATFPFRLSKFSYWGRSSSPIPSLSRKVL